MMTYPDLKQIKGIGPKRYEKIHTKMIAEKLSLADVYGMSASDLKTTFGIPINVARTIATTEKQSDMKQASVKAVQKSEPKAKIVAFVTLELSHPEYPEKLKRILGDKAPNPIYIWGNLDLLNRPAVGFCGSRNVTDKGLEVTADVAKQISELGWVTVSGHARGVDATAHRTSLENDSGTIIVLPQGINTFKLRKELKKIAKPENLLVISEFDPNAGWAVGRAMGRNKTIISLSDAMVLVESRSSGGTFNAGKTALKLQQPLFVVQFSKLGESNEGNLHFIKHGAIQLFKSQTTGHANIERLKLTVEMQQDQTEDPSQLTLFES